MSNNTNQNTVNNFGILSIYYDDEPSIEVSYRPGSDYTWDCQCNDVSAQTNDCIKRTYGGNQHYCDGNFCEACSVRVYLNQSADNQIITSRSIIIHNESINF